MDIRKTISEALAQPVDRRQFLLQVGALVLALLGITSLLQRLGLRQDESSDSGSPYGGRPGGGSR